MSYKNSIEYNCVRVVASLIFHEISLLIGEFAIRGTELTCNVRLGTDNSLLIEQYIAIRRTLLYLQWRIGIFQGLMDNNVWDIEPFDILGLIKVLM